MFRGGRTNLLRELVNLRHHVRNLLQREAQILVQQQAFLHHGGALFHVVHGFPRFLLNTLNQFRNFLGGLRRLFRQLAHFLGHYRETQPMLARARRFNRRVQSQQVGLLRQIINHLDDLADVVRAPSQHVDNFRRRLNRVARAVQSLGRLVHRHHAGLHFLARPV